jgi:phosphoribosylformylglycinamidine (FGAM) synthase-like enzyme
MSAPFCVCNGGDAALVTPQMVRDMGLNDAEYQQILGIQGREPTLTELGMFSVMWSEHCGYKYSRPVLALFKNYKEAQESGSLENAGVIPLDENLGIVFKVESHNHPSAVEPFQGAATGVGGILRDIFTMGARPIANLNSLRFGPLDEPRNRYLFENVVAGISHYGNCVGVPTVAGEIYFHPCYSGNPLVNAMSVGIVDLKNVASAAAKGVGNPVVYVGSATGKDGIHGATFASVELGPDSESKRPNVQMGDPFLEKLLIEATLEALASGYIVGIQDMGAAGLTCSTCETAAKAGTGMEIDVRKVPLREADMTAYEIMLSESQERMLCIVEKGKEQHILDIFKKWGLNAAVIGVVTDDGLTRIKDNGVVVAEIRAKALTDECPVYTLQTAEPDYIKQVQAFDLTALPEPLVALEEAETEAAEEAEEAEAEESPESESEPSDPAISEAEEATQQIAAALAHPRFQAGRTTYADALINLLDSPSLASKAWVTDQYDSMVQTQTVTLPGSDAAILRIRGSKKGIALKLDGNGRYGYLDPFVGGQIAVAEAARNVVCVGARPVAVTDNLNFANPEKPTGFWQFRRSVEGIAAATEAFGTPVVSGNVSFYNETPEYGPIHPTPTIGMLGILDDVNRRCTAGFRPDGEGDTIVLLTAYDDPTGGLGGSEYLSVIHGEEAGVPPRLDLEGEKRLHTLLLEGIGEGLFASCHDVSDGGLAITLAESAMMGEVGALILLNPNDFPGDLPPSALLFGEAQGRAVVTVRNEKQFTKLKERGEKLGVRVAWIGTVGGENLRVAMGPDILCDLPVTQVTRLSQNALPRRMNQRGEALLSP